MPGKEMGSRGPRRSASDWQGLIEEWQGSSIDLIEFCRERRIAPSSLRWWRWRLGIPADRGPVSVMPREVGEKKDWIRLEIESPSSASVAFELRWPSGRVLVIPGTFDAEALSRLLGALERSAC